MNKEEWDKFCNVFNLKVEVEVRKEVTRMDILETLINEGEFIFKGRNGSFTSMELSRLKGKVSDEQIKLFKELLWGQVEDYLRIVEEKMREKKNE